MSLVNRIYERGEVVTADGQIRKLHSHISREEGTFLYNLIRADLGIVRTLEIGCAYGLSSLHICKALGDRSAAHHIIVDPHQAGNWESIGILNLHREGLNNFILMEDYSEFVLPRMAAESAHTLDLAFVDGWHTFDQALVECFYLTKLLRVGGYLVLHDAGYLSISRLIRHLETYPCYERYAGVNPTKPRGKDRMAQIALELPLIRRAMPYLNHRIQQAISIRFSMIALRKRTEDVRSWDWHEDF